MHISANPGLGLECAYAGQRLGHLKVAFWGACGLSCFCCWSQCSCLSLLLRNSFGSGPSRRIVAAWLQPLFQRVSKLSSGMLAVADQRYFVRRIRGDKAAAFRSTFAPVRRTFRAGGQRFWIFPCKIKFGFEMFEVLCGLVDTIIRNHKEACLCH